MTHKSPFYIVQDFISPLICEDIVDSCNFNVPDVDPEGDCIKTTKTCEVAEQIIYERLQYLMPELQAYYQLLYKGMEQITFEWYAEDAFDAPHAENSYFTRGKWLRTKQRDLTAVLFLSDYQDQPQLEEEFEVYGGKLEFPQHRFGFNPERGTLIVFPSDPHFINNTAVVKVGNLYQARIQIAATTPFLYNPQDFQGNYTTWFKPLIG